MFGCFGSSKWVCVILQLVARVGWMWPPLNCRDALRTRQGVHVVVTAPSLSIEGHHVPSLYAYVV